jgi:5'-3' exonuclease
MILVDLNQVLISNLMVQTRGKPEVKPNLDMVRQMVLNSLRGFNIKFRDEYGKMILCSDAANPWRREIFPLYKHGRRKGRVDSDTDWDNIFDIMLTIKNELIENFPYIVMHVAKAEADDIIASLIKLREEDKYLIVSGDKDFIQLHHYGDVYQFSPILKGYIGENEDPIQFLHEQIIKGDRSDGVPNVLSADDIFLDKAVRQRPINKKRLAEFTNIETSLDIEPSIKKNYQRNKALIDLSQIPEYIEKSIINTYKNYKAKDRSLLLSYFMKNKLKTLIEQVNDF